MHKEWQKLFIASYLISANINYIGLSCFKQGKAISKLLCILLFVCFINSINLISQADFDSISINQQIGGIPLYCIAKK